MKVRPNNYIVSDPIISNTRYTVLETKADYDIGLITVIGVDV